MKRYQVFKGEVCLATVSMHDWDAAKLRARGYRAEYEQDMAARDDYKCELCGQHITDGKPCGCGART